MINIFFNRPGFPLSTEQLIDDILSAKSRVVLASAWFTDYTIAQAVIDCTAPIILIILNETDIARGEKEAYRRVLHHLEKDSVVILGGHSWETGVMHHKFCLVDETIVWTGSFNFTFQAKKNYETLLRIEDPEVNAQFWDEAIDITRYVGHLSTDAPRDPAFDPPEIMDEWFICYDCQRKNPSGDACWHHYPGVICIQCCLAREEHSYSP